MDKVFGMLMLTCVLSSCIGQQNNQPVKSPVESTSTDNLLGGPCQDCEAVLDYKLLNLEPKSIDTLPGYIETNPKLKISGTVFQADGTSPAENVILYLYHTNRDSIYEPSENPIGWEKRHGQYRGWIKTDPQGKYTFYTFRPTPYPAASEPEHLHIYIKEPNKRPYYIDNYIFQDDPTLKQETLDKQQFRAGSGLIELQDQNGILVGYRDIVLGLNIPNYRN